MEFPQMGEMIENCHLYENMHKYKEIIPIVWSTYTYIYVWRIHKNRGPSQYKDVVLPV